MKVLPYMCYCFLLAHGGDHSLHGQIITHDHPQPPFADSRDLAGVHDDNVQYDANVESCQGEPYHNDLAAPKAQTRASESFLSENIQI